MWRGDLCTYAASQLNAAEIAGTEHRTFVRDKPGLRCGLLSILSFRLLFSCRGAYSKCELAAGDLTVRHRQV